MYILSAFLYDMLISFVMECGISNRLLSYEHPTWSFHVLFGLRSRYIRHPNLLHSAELKFCLLPTPMNSGLEQLLKSMHLTPGIHIDFPFIVSATSLTLPIVLSGATCRLPESCVSSCPCCARNSMYINSSLSENTKYRNSVQHIL